VKRADVVLENFAPGAMDRLGCGWSKLREVNPRLIYAQGSGYGQSGPYRDYPAMDLTVQAMAGVMSVTGYADRPPVKAGPAICDFFGGVHLFGAVMTALYEREKTGVGRAVDVSMQEAVYASLSSNLGLYYGSGGDVPMRTGNRHGGLAEAPYNVYPTQDGYIAIICVGETHWKSLIQAMERPELADDPRFASLEWTFARIRYDAWTLPPGRRYDIFDEPWTIDFPAADQNLSRRVRTVTSIQVHDPVVLRLEDPNLWNYPWIYIVEGGNLRLRETEVPILREFLLRGGTLTFDDFHGPIEWSNVEQELKRVFPDRKIIDLPPEHPIFHCFYEFSSFPQSLPVPHIAPRPRIHRPPKR